MKEAPPVVAPAGILPFESHFADVAGFKMHYLDEGQGPVVLLLHGNPTWCFYYRKLIEELRPHFRVIAPDYIGMGLSDHPPDKHFRASERAAHLEQFIAGLGIDRLSLVMHDWGGPIGTSFAVRHPEKIEKLVYLNTTLTETESLPAIIKRAHLPIIGPLLTKHTMHFLRLMAEFGVVRTMPAAVREGYFFPYRTRARRTAIWDFVADIPFDSAHPSYTEMLGFAERLPELRGKPALVVWGLRDPCFHREMLTKVLQHFPHAEVIEIPDAAHLVLEDAPEIANPAIANFLRGEPARERERAAEDEKPGEVNALYEGFCAAAETAARSEAAVIPDFSGVRVRYSRATFQELRSTVSRYERGLAELGMLPGDRVLMLVPPGVEFLALSYAVMGRGGVPVYIDPGMGKANLLKCISDINPDVLIGTPRAQLLRLTGKRLLPRLKFSLTALDLPVSTGRDLAFLKKFSPLTLAPARGDGIALVAFTSGATGTPKGVVFTNEMIREQLRIFKESLGFEAGGRDLPLLPIFSLFTVALGVTSVFPRMNSAKPLSLDPERIVRVIQDLSVTYSFGSPTLWNKIAEYCVRSGTELGTVRRIFMAGAPVPAATLQRVQGVIPNGTAFTPYGATEALPVTLIDGRTISSTHPAPAAGGEIGTLVGRSVAGVTVRIVRFEESDRGYGGLYTVLPAGEIGEIIVKGRNVSPRYLNRPDADLKSKVQVGDSLWHRMGDMGYFDADGNLYFCGRRAHMVATEARTYYSIPTERIFNQHPKVRRSALVPLGKEAGVVVEPLPEHWPVTPEAQAEFADELRRLAKGDPITEHIEKVLFHPSFPVDARHNAKIFRDKLGEWAAGQLQLERAA